jgi:hypothetical protein
VLSRAVGLDRHFHLDFADGELQVGDCFLLCSDGVWGVLDKQRICGVLIAHPDAQQAAASLTSLALASGSQDNASAVVLRVAELPAENLRDSLEGTSRLPLPPRSSLARPSTALRIDEVLHDSRATLLYRVTDQFSGQPLVLKTLRPELADDAEEIRALIMEEWRARRIVSPFFAQLLPA